ncbi:hypothetical protein ABD05_01995 [Burkholderia pyrrocinia]|nr:hypothetical protein ABD05_01995 [Burkholderia pyrrocinia]
MSTQGCFLLWQEMHMWRAEITWLSKARKLLFLRQIGSFIFSGIKGAGILRILVVTSSTNTIFNEG